MIYVVMGTSGEYSDRTEWAVAYYIDKDLAERHVTLAEGYMRAARAIDTDYDYERQSKLLKDNIFDPRDEEYPGLYMDASYYVLEVGPGTVTLDTAPVVPE